MLNRKQPLPSLDVVLLILVFAIVIFGIIIIGSATKINIYHTSAEYKSQIIWFITGIFLMAIAAAIDYRTICKFYYIIYGFNMVLLILVLLVGSGDGVSRWLFGIQPSEFAKVFMILFISKYIDVNKEKINNFKVLGILFLLTIIPVILIKKQPSLSASLVILAIMCVLLFVGKISFRYILTVLIILLPIVVILIVDLTSEKHFLLSKILDDYQLQRIVSNLNLDLTGTDAANYQTRNSAWAIGSGQLMGKGLYNGTVNQLSYLPESHNDFIFSVIGEEFGFIGCISVLAVMFCIIGRCLMIASKAIDNLGTLIASGVAGMLAFQTFVNVGVATGILPNTGMPFPFLSYGGSSMWINMISIGLVINVGLRKPKSMF